MRVLLAIPALVLCLMMAGCFPLLLEKRVEMTSQFDPKEAQYSLGSGNNTIKGSAVMLRRDGMTVTCAGRPVLLMPVTRYTTEMVQLTFNNTYSGYMPENPFSGKVVRITNSVHPSLAVYVRRTTGDANGFFTFANIPDGNYFILVDITWDAGNVYREGGNLMQRVSVSGGGITEVTLSPHGF